jgi:hypothetical protein
MDRTAHRRVGGAAAVAFAALLLIGASHGPAQASPATPAATPDSGTQVEPSQPGSQVAPSQPGPQLDPSQPRPGVPHERDGEGFDGGGPSPSSPAPESGTDMS